MLLGMTEAVELTLCGLARAIETREVTVSEVINQTLKRIELTEPTLHAYAYYSHEAARSAADRLDRDLSAGTYRGRLHGIPIGVKDSCFTVDMPTEAGSRVLAGFMPEYDATVVRRLREAGAVIIGKTVTHEFTYGQNVPATRNAWRSSDYPGGSSAGSAVAVAVGSAQGAIGTDTGGSIRVPAALNGIVGLKPTFGRVSRHGAIQMSPSLDCVGPLARTVRDCAAIYDAIAGHDPLDPSSSRESPTAPLADVPLSSAGLVVGIERSYFFSDEIQSDVRVAVEAVALDLEAHGVTLVDVKLPELELMPVVALAILLADTSSYHRRNLRECMDLFEVGTRRMLELGELLPATHYVTAQRARTLLREVVKNLFDEYRLDALLAPTTPHTTVPIDEYLVGLVSESGDSEPGVTLASFVRNAFPANLVGMPAISVPCGFDRSGLPIGLQLMARPFGEETLFRLGHAYEERNPWYLSRPSIVATQTA
jgi:aspartyl-tRNA(Asn)/glutamyl-tRNA(Gln) amidotransferase subunit A